MLGKRKRGNSYKNVGPAKRLRVFRSNFKKLMRGRRRRPRGGFAKAVKKVILKTADTKFRSQQIRDVSDGLLGGGLFHNTIQNYHLWDQTNNIPTQQNLGTSLFPPQGTEDFEMLGNEIYMTGIMLRGTMQIPYDRVKGTTVKMWLVQYNSVQEAPTNLTFFHNITNNTHLDPLDSDRYRAKYMGVLHPIWRGIAGDDSVSSRDATLMFKRWIPMKKKVLMRNNPLQRMDNLKERCAIVFAAYDKFSASTNDRIVTAFQIAATMYFKDP